MKNLILTFVFALLSLVSFSQVLTVQYDGDLNGSIVATPDTLNTLELDLSDSVVFTTGSTFGCKINGYFVGSDIPEVTFKDSVAGIYIVRLTTAVSPFCFKIIVSDQSVSTSENTLTREDLKVYPSPAISDIKISFYADNSDMPLNIFSLNGQLIFTDTNKREKGMNVFDLNVNEFVPGIYFVKVGNHTEKLIIE